MKVLAILIVAVAAAHAATLQEQWQEFKLAHGKTYKSLLEEKRRFAVFTDNVRTIEEHNEKFAKGEETFTMAVNQFADMTDEEFKSTHLLTPRAATNSPREVFNATGIVGDETINWVKKGLVTSVKNQGGCGACWAFSAVGAIEGQVAKKTGKLVDLSPQNLVDCLRTADVDGCRGGNMDDAFDFVAKSGITTEAKYPYHGRQGACRAPTGDKLVSGHVDVEGDETVLLKALTTVGPISIALDSAAIRFYSSGIVSGRGCSPEPDHGILLVGAGNQNGHDYWLVKNSWGAQWGESGYFKIVRGKAVCAILTMNSYPKM